MQKVLIFGEKRPVHQLESNPRPPECKSVTLPIELYGCGFQWMLLEFSPLICLQPAAEFSLITALTCSDKLEVGGWWVYDKSM